MEGGREEEGREEGSRYFSYERKLNHKKFPKESYLSFNDFNIGLQRM